MGLFDVIVEKKDDKYIIKIIVAAGSELPYYVKKNGMSEKGCFMRIGSSSEPMPVKMIEELFAKRTRNSIGKIESPTFNLNFEQLRIYYQEKGLTLNDKFAANLELHTNSQKYNYVAYLLADKNGTSIKVAKYSGNDRVDLIENNEFGFCSLVKATKQVLDKLDVENRTLTKITSKTRLEQRLVDTVALREAVINAIVHNDYSTEVPPKFELFDNRIEITSTGGLPVGFSREEFFAGYSYPRNKEIMRVFKDLELVEYLGSGIPRILQKYSESAFIITDNFLRIVFPFDKDVQKKLIAQDKALKKAESEQSKDTVNPEKDTVKDTVNSKKDTVKLSKNEQKIIENMKINSKITTKELAVILEINERNIKKNIEKLKSKKIIERVGSDKTGEWKIL